MALVHPPAEGRGLDGPVPMDGGGEEVSPTALEDGERQATSEVEVEVEKEAGPALLTLLCLICAIEGADTMLLRAVLFAIQKDLGLTLGEVAVMTLCQALFQALAAPIWGVIADRRVLRRRTILTIGALLQGTVTACVASANGLVLMVVLRSMTGAMLASLRPISNGIVADVTSEARRGKVYGWMQLAMHVGMVAGSFCAPLSVRQIGPMQGWRVSFLLIGAFAFVVGLLIAGLMKEPEREQCPAEQSEGKGACAEELRRIIRYLRTPTFCTLVVQGCFGCVPWNALGYQILFYQVSGLKDLSSVLQVANLVAGGTGALMGGLIGDCCARRSRYHGRPFVAQISILAGIPGVWLLFKVIPPADMKFAYYLAVVIFLGLTTTWCPTGVNWPLLSEVVDPNGRSAVLAWQTALEGAFAAVCGNAAVGFLADKVFGYDLHRDIGDGGNLENQQALGNALVWTTSLPWALCFIIAGVLHWGYPRDLRRLQREREQQKEKQKQQEQQKAEQDDANPVMAQPWQQVCDVGFSKGKLEKAEAASPTRPRLMGSAAASAHLAIGPISGPGSSGRAAASSSSSGSAGGAPGSGGASGDAGDNPVASWV